MSVSQFKFEALTRVIISDLSRPLQSSAEYGDTTFRPGTCPYQAAKHCECCAATPAAAPLGPLNTIGTGTLSKENSPYLWGNIVISLVTSLQSKSNIKLDYIAILCSDFLDQFLKPLFDMVF